MSDNTTDRAAASPQQSGCCGALSNSKNNSKRSHSSLLAILIKCSWKMQSQGSLLPAPAPHPARRRMAEHVEIMKKDKP